MFLGFNLLVLLPFTTTVYILLSKHSRASISGAENFNLPVGWVGVEQCSYVYTKLVLTALEMFVLKIEVHVIRDL